MRDKQPSQVGWRLARTRGSRGLTLRGLEDLSGVSNSAISQIESGWVHDPGVGMVAKLARALDVDPCWLAFGKAGK